MPFPPITDTDIATRVTMASLLLYLRLIIFVVLLLPAISISIPTSSSTKPLVINTWSGDFKGAAAAAYKELSSSASASSVDIDNSDTRLDALEEGLNFCELNRCGGSVGFGGHPDASGEVSLDALIFDGVTHDVGAVGGLRRVKKAISVARGVLEHTNHSLLVGDAATRFAVDFLGFPEESLSTPESDQAHAKWVENNCQPNYYHDFVNSTTQCPPYYLMPEQQQEEEENVVNGFIRRRSERRQERRVRRRQRRQQRNARFSPHVNEDNHDTIGMVVVDAQGDLACGVTTNGLGNKVPGRVGDTPLPGAGCYVDNEVGGAACTGDGDVMLRFSPSALSVEYMRHGASPQEACEKSILKIAKYYPNFTGGMICVNKKGEYGAAGWNWVLSFSVQSPSTDGVEEHDVPPLTPPPAMASTMEEEASLASMS